MELKFNGHNQKQTGYCACSKSKMNVKIFCDVGYWDVCDKCKRPIKNGFHFYEKEEEGRIDFI